MSRPPVETYREKVTISADLEAEVERQLNQRTRDIKLTGALLRLYEERSWPQRSKLARSWTIWITFVSICGLPITAWVAPHALWLAFILFGVVVPVWNVLGFLVWRQPRKPWVEALTCFLLIAGTAVMMDVLGVVSGDANFERYATAALFIPSNGIMLFGLSQAWSIAIAFFSPALFLGVQLFNPAMDALTAVGATMFYTICIFAVVNARQTVTILAHKSFLLSLRDGYRSKALLEANRQLEMLATRDPLTGLANRRSAANHIEKVWDDEAIPKNAIAFVMADIDHFKKLNDTAGHAMGDQCLTRVAKSIEASVRSGIDVVCRHGGEEFLIILNGVTNEMAWTLAERIRSGVEALSIVNPGIDPPDGVPAVVTISVGVAFAQEGVEPDLVARWADDSLYDAKHSGRNRVFMSAVRELDPLPVNAVAQPDRANAIH